MLFIILHNNNLTTLYRFIDLYNNLIALHNLIIPHNKSNLYNSILY